ncbi:hypothetical protein [Mycoplasmopsis gallinarum]|uniref:Lipoprotein n=1 Tax=Mycoplasmopsis gallinarum TaxID=29557 RepID=A0A168RL18_9BACT|nr:hypothetical protein [Mycoplasmopsis gallinarum]OAB49081.1 hypothetical protein MGALLINA_01160 [Mycoplasmopsis gallinarum]
MKFKIKYLLSSFTSLSLLPAFSMACTNKNIDTEKQKYFSLNTDSDKPKAEKISLEKQELDSLKLEDLHVGVDENTLNKDVETLKELAMNNPEEFNFDFPVTDLIDKIPFDSYISNFTIDYLYARNLLRVNWSFIFKNKKIVLKNDYNFKILGVANIAYHKAEVIVEVSNKTKPYLKRIFRIKFNNTRAYADPNECKIVLDNHDLINVYKYNLDKDGNYLEASPSNSHVC